MTSILVISKTIGITAFLFFGLTIIIYLLSGIFKSKSKFLNIGHFVTGFMTFLLIILHSFGFLMKEYSVKNLLDPFSTYLDFCLLCETKTDLFLTFGRISLILLFFSLSVVILGKTTKMYKSWKMWYRLILIAFIFGLFHFWGNNNQKVIPEIIGGAILLLVTVKILKKE